MHLKFREFDDNHDYSLHFHLKNDKIIELIFENGEHDEPIIKRYE